MRKLCPNFEREDCLDTVLEVPIPEEIFSYNTSSSSMLNKSSIKGRITQIQFLLGVVGAPLIPFPVRFENQQPIINFISVKDNHPIEKLTAKYIVQQFVAAVGGDHAMDKIGSMYAMGKVRMGATEFSSGKKSKIKKKKKRMVKGKSIIDWEGEGEMGGFVLWQKRPELWCLEMMMGGCKISAGCDGKVAWRQTPWHHSHASRGPHRPLRRFIQGLDPKSTAAMFFNSTCTGEKTVDGEDCFTLKLESESLALRARSSKRVEIIRHTMWGYFSQKTGLLTKLEDSHLLKIKGSKADNQSIFWETHMESLLQDYRTIDGVNIAYSGKTWVSLSRYGKSSETHTRARMEEVWQIEEVDFNMKGLSLDLFLPPSDLKVEEDEVCFDDDYDDDDDDVVGSNVHISFMINPSSVAASKISASKVVAIDDEDDDDSEALLK